MGSSVNGMAGERATRAFLPLADEDPGGTAIVSPERSLTWGELEDRARRFANGVEELGLGADDRVAVLSHNRPEILEVLLGNLRAGTRHVPVNWHLTEDEVTYILGDSGTRLLVTDPAHEALARSAAEQAGVGHVLVAEGSFEEWLTGQPDREPANQQAGSVLFYTSGTTGRQKAVLRSDQGGSVGEVLARFAKVGTVWRFPEGGVHLVACPLYHATPPSQALFAVALRQSIVIMPAFDPEGFLALVERHRITTTNLVPTQLVRLLRLPEEVRERYDLSSLQGVWHGAAPCPEWAKRAAIEWLGPVVIEYFGSSEGTGPLIATSEEWLGHPGTVGRPAAPGIEVSVVGEDGRDLPGGEVGTLYFRRPEGPPEYQGAPEKTSASRLADGRFTVGDVGRVDDDGFVYLADRKIDMIISGGVNIYPSETEGVLSEHPAVFDCAVFGIPDEEWGEQVKAAVQLVEGVSATEDELLEWCRSRLARYKCPRTIDLHASLPREASGKLKKRLLREPWWETAGRRI